MQCFMLGCIHLSQDFPLSPKWAVPGFTNATLGIFQGQLSSFSHELLSLSKRWVCSVCFISDIVLLPLCLFAVTHDRMDMQQQWHDRLFLSLWKFYFNSQLKGQGIKRKIKSEHSSGWIYARSNTGCNSHSIQVPALALPITICGAMSPFWISDFGFKIERADW